MDLRRLSRDRPVLIAGPTASGKSGLAARIIEAGGGVIVNADALQVYDCWRILTARPSAAEEAALPHRLFGHVGREADYSVGHWLREVADVLAEGLRPVIVGGTGLYLSSLTAGLAVVPPVPPEVRAEADALLRDGGLGALLAGVDEATLAGIDRANPARVQRAWEVRRATGRGLAAWQAETGPPLLPRRDALALVVDPGRDALRSRIAARFDAMMAAGALDEARRERPHWSFARPSGRAIGAPELMAHLDGRMDLDAAVEAAKTATQRYAKRQRTWLRGRMADWTHVEP